MEIIGQNGNDGDHYNKLDINKDGIIDKFEQLKAKERIQEIDKIKTNNNLTQEWTKKLELEKNFLKKKLDENIKIY